MALPPAITAACLAAGLAAAPSPAPATQWIRVRSPHFEVVGDAPEGQLRGAAQRLEEFRRVMSVLLPARGEGDPAIVVLAFRDSRSFQPYLPRHEGAAREADGFFQGGTGRSYIAVNLASGRQDPFDPLYHEYAHLALNRSLPAQPAWVSEGLAELYSRWERAGDQVAIGLPRPEHLRTLRRRGLMPLPELLQSDYASSAYNRGEEREVFYAQSWLLAHQLLLSRPAGRQQLEAYLLGILQGLGPVESFRRGLGEEPRLAQGRLQAHLASASHAVALVSLPAAGEPFLSVSIAPAAEVECMLGDLLLHGGRTREAARHFSRALEADPGFAPAREGLAQIALGKARWDEARAHLQAARERDPDSPVALYRFAEAMVREAAHRSEVLSDEDTQAAVAALEKSVARAPHLADAVHLLARLKPEPVHRRIALLEAVFDREPHRTERGVTLAGLYGRTNDLGRASAVLTRAREAARDDDMRFLCNHLLGRVGYVSLLTAEASGRLVELECLPGGALTFLLQPDGPPLRLRAESPVSVMLYRADGERVQESLTCGPQNVPVRAWYTPALPGDPHGVQGTLISLTFPETP